MLDAYSLSGDEASGTVEVQPDVPSEQVLASALGISPCPGGDDSMVPPSHTAYMTLGTDGRAQHKATVLREAFDPTHDIDYKNAVDRLLRVRSFSIGGDSWNRKGGLKHGQHLKPEE